MISIKKIVVLVLFICGYGIRTQAQKTTSFNFSRTAQPVSGWINVYGDPETASTPIIVADPSTGFTISSVAAANWYGVNGGASSDAGGADGGTFFPAAVMKNIWFQGSDYYGLYNAAIPQLELSGLKIDSVYTLKMTGSFAQNIGLFNLNPIRYTVTGAIVYGYVDVNGNYNTSDGAIFHNVAPDANGKVRIYVNTYGGSNVSAISGLQVIEGHSTAPTPVVSFTNPSNGDVLPEDGYIILKATASEAGGSIAKVEFYADTTKLAEVTAAPYNFTWLNPDPGKYVLKARAIDGTGNTTTASINVSVESLSSFWSMTGNIAMNPDSNFIGNVDSVRLAFRTKNIERMSLSATGNLGIGTIAPSAQLHTTGTVRLAGLTNDSSKARVLVSDTSGNLYYRSVSSLSGRWQFANGTLYDSSDNIGIGTNNTQGYKLAVNGTAIFTKVKVKTAGTWPDYVFKKGYELPDLSSIEKYVSEHKHLPGILSESEVAKDGVDVAEHQAALLKKVEELTLYLIEENKKLRAQNDQLQRQQVMLEKLQAQIEALQKAKEEKK